MNIKIFVVIFSLLSYTVAFAVEKLPTGTEEGQQVQLGSEALRVEDTEIGEVYGFSTIEKSFSLSNVGIKSIIIERIKPRFAEDKVIAFTPGNIGAGKESKIKLLINVGSASGRFAHYFDVYAKNLEEPAYSFAVRGFADWIVDPKSTQADLGSIDLDRGIDRAFGLVFRPGAELKLTDVVEKDRRFDVSIDPSGKSLRIKSRADAPLGVFDAHVVVATDNSKQKRVGFDIRGQILGRIVPDSNPVDFGLLRMGEESERLVRLTQVDGKPIKIGALRKEGAKFEAALKECVPASASCKLLRLRVPPQMERGQIGGVVYVDLPDYGRELPVRFGVIVIGKETKILDLDEELKVAGERPPEISSVLQSAAQTPIPPREMANPPGTGPLLKWQAANEYGVYGYEIFRGDSENGPFSRMNDRIIQVLDDSGKIGSIYRWRDDSAVSGADYWYYIGIVNNDGRKSKLSSPQKVKAR